MRALLVISLGLAVVGARGALAQDSMRMVAGFGVDTAAAAWSEASWHAAVPGIYRAWSDYLRSARPGQAPTPRWAAAEQRMWPAYDLTTVTGTYQGFDATVLDIRPAHPGDTATSVVKTLFARASGPERDVRPIALTRVYAIREDGRWEFSNALLRHTRDWARETVGPITYVVSPGRPFDRARARAAVDFADSVAAAFGVPGLDSLSYYVADGPDELHRALGVDWTFGGLGYGYALPANRLVLSGDPVFGEENRHELVHVLLAPLLAEGRTHPIINEGVATWLGGSVGLAFPRLMREYAAYLRSHPDGTIDTVLEGTSPDRGWSPTGAVLALMVHEHGGFPAVEDLFTSGRTMAQLRAALSRILDMAWPEIAARARARVLEFEQSGAGHTGAARRP